MEYNILIEEKLIDLYVKILTHAARFMNEMRQNNTLAKMTSRNFSIKQQNGIFLDPYKLIFKHSDHLYEDFY